MSAGTNFFIVSCSILIFSIINLSIGPIINRKVATGWDTGNCAILSDQYEENKSKMEDSEKEEAEWQITRCRNRKGMYAMEFISFYVNTALGFTCFLLGWYGLKDEIKPKTGKIGMVCGIIGFILTFVYVVFNGIVYTNDYPSENIYKTDGEGAYAEIKGDGYQCFYFNKKDDRRSFIAKFSDLIKSQYNYNYELLKSFDNTEKSSCRTSNYPGNCLENNGYISGKRYNCNFLFIRPRFVDFNNYDRSARFLTALLFSIFILLLYCGLTYCGFKLLKETS